MKKSHTNDIDLRLLVTRALLSYGTPRESIRHEITLDSSSSDGRADMVVALDRGLVGIEIKSGKDTLGRLETQREQYRRRFDKLCLVVDARHVPDGDGKPVSNWKYHQRFGAVAIVDRSDDGVLCFRPTMFPDGLPWEDCARWERRFGATDWQAPHAMLSMLWADEALSAADQLVSAGKIPAVGGGQRYRVIPHLAEHASISTLRPLVATALRRRELNRWEKAFWARFDAECTAEAAE